MATQKQIKTQVPGTAGNEPRGSLKGKFVRPSPEFTIASTFEYIFGGKGFKFDDQYRVIADSDPYRIDPRFRELVVQNPRGVSANVTAAFFDLVAK